MIRRCLLLIPLLLVVSCAETPAADAPKVGDKVYAQWRPNAIYHGKADKAVDVGFHITFDDGDRGDIPLALIAVDRAPKKADVKVGTRTLALWVDGVYYPGWITAIVQDKYQIQFDDGDTRAVGLDELRPTAGKTSAMAAPKVGDKVWAQWKPNDWYHGKVSKTTDVGLHVAFDDGDQADLPLALVCHDRAPKAADVKAGSRVLGLWTDDKFYPGTITAVEGGKYSVTFDDGDTRIVGLDQLRLLNE